KRLMEQYQNENNDIDITQLIKAKERLNKRKDKLKDLYVEGLITMESLKEEYAGIDEGIKNIDSELAGFDETQEKIAHVDDITDNVEKILMNNEFSNEDMRAIIEKIVVYPDKSVEIFMK
ncbi:MAG: hypothetical protein Q4G33_13715, partial [bacterium]|nr:hypothetical protein [bacterium]